VKTTDCTDPGARKRKKFVAWVTNPKTGKRRYARSYGKCNVAGPTPAGPAYRFTRGTTASVEYHRFDVAALLWPRYAVTAAGSAPASIARVASVWRRRPGVNGSIFAFAHAAFTAS
jgi:hypothetical protein